MRQLPSLEMSIPHPVTIAIQAVATGGGWRIQAVTIPAQLPTDLLLHIATSFKQSVENEIARLAELAAAEKGPPDEQPPTTAEGE